MENIRKSKKKEEILLDILEKKGYVNIEQIHDEVLARADYNLILERETIMRDLKYRLMNLILEGKVELKGTYFKVENSELQKEKVDGDKK